MARNTPRKRNDAIELLEQIELLLKHIHEVVDRTEARSEAADARIEAKLEHHHRILHALGEGIAGISRHLAHPTGMSSEELATVVARLKAHAEKLEGIAAPPQT